MPGESISMQGQRRKPGGELDPYPISASDEPERQLLRRYLARKRDDLARLAQAIDGADFETISRIGHNLAGSGAAYGLLRISVIGQQIEAAAERRSLSDASAIVAELDRFLSSILVRKQS